MIYAPDISYIRKGQKMSKSIQSSTTVTTTGTFSGVGVSVTVS